MKTIVRTGSLVAVLGLLLTLLLTSTPGALAGPGLLTAGLFALAYGMHLKSTIPPLNDQTTRKRESVIFICAGVITLFWFVALYADVVGKQQARTLHHRLPSEPSVTVYSEKDLGLAGLGISATTTAGSSRYRFQYSGLRLLVRSDQRYFLLPASWQRGSGVVFVLPDNDEIRMEFTAQ